MTTKELLGALMTPRRIKALAIAIPVLWTWFMGVVVLGSYSVAAYDRAEVRFTQREQHRPQTNESSSPKFDNGNGSSTVQPLRPVVGTPGPNYKELATVAANLCGVDPELFHRLITVESHWRVEAVSPTGALGLAQILPSTLHHVSPTLRHWVPFDRLLGSACYLRQMYEREMGTEEERWFRAALSYRYGPNRSSTPSTWYARMVVSVEGEDR